MSTLNIADQTVVTIAKVESIEVNIANLNAEVLEYVFNYGLKQILNDAGSAGKSVEDKLAMAEKKLAAMYEGVIRTQRAAKPGMSPRESLIYGYAKDDVKKVLKAAGRKLADVDEEKLEAAIAKQAAANEASYGKRADLELESRKSTVDLADLDL